MDQPTSHDTEDADSFDVTDLLLIDMFSLYALMCLVCPSKLWFTLNCSFKLIFYFCIVHVDIQRLNNYFQSYPMYTMQKINFILNFQMP
jgi:hypothetical protein